MDDFDAQLAALDQLFDEGQTDDGLCMAVQMCRHSGPQQEPPNMRDARADLLCKVIMYKIFHGAQADVLSLPESALLDQKIYSWKYGRSAESKLFPGLQTTFDSDDAEALTLAKYIQKVKDRFHYMAEQNKERGNNNVRFYLINQVSGLQVHPVYTVF